MWPVRVVVPDELAKHPLQVASSDDQQMVETLSACGAYPTLGERVGVRRLDRSPDDAGADRAEYLVEWPG